MRNLITLVASLVISVQVCAVQVGDTAPAISLPQLSGGKTLSLKQYRGKVVYLDFWASWCGPCRQSLPLMNEVRNRLKSKGFEVLAVNLDEEPEAGLAFLKLYPVQYPVVSDVKGTTPATYKIQGMPTSFLIDRKGKVRQVHVGFKKGDIKKIESEITELL